jgi:hypothetical protein
LPKFSDKVSEVVVMTTAQFLGKRISDEGDGEKKTKTSTLPDLSAFNCVFSDEFFQSSAWDIIAIVRRLMKLRAEQTPTDEVKLRAFYDSLRGEESAALKAARSEHSDAETELREARDRAERKLASEQDYVKTLAEERKERLKSPPPKREDAAQVCALGAGAGAQEGRSEEQLELARCRAQAGAGGSGSSDKFVKEWTRRQREWDRGAAAREHGARGCGAARAGAAADNFRAAGEGAQEPRRAGGGREEVLTSGAPSSFRRAPSSSQTATPSS